MAETCIEDSSIAWLWTIEYLASFPQIDPSILHDLIDEAPELPEDLGKNAREMIALKCLEHLFPINTNSDEPPSNDVSNSKHTFPLHENCEDVLQFILKETSVSDLKMAAPDLVKWDIHPFILHKRASLPKCALQLLKDAILEGTHPCAASLREISGLMHKSNDGNDGIAVDDDESDAQIMAAEGSNIHLPLGNKDGMVGCNAHQKNLLPLKRNRDILDNEHPVGDYQEDQGGMNDGNHLNAKKFRYDASCSHKSGEQILIPQSRDEFVEDSTEIMVGVTERGSYCVERDSEVERLGSQKLVDIEKYQRSPTAEANPDFQHNQCDYVNSTTKMPQGTPEDGACQHNLMDEVSDAQPRPSSAEPSLRTLPNVSADDTRDTCFYGDQLKPPNVSLSGFPRGNTVEKSGDCSENLYQEDTSSESSGHHHEKIDIAMKKSHFLSSQCTLSHVSLSDWTQINLCVQCGKDGQLLVCNAVGCPLVVHEKCLSCSPKFDEEGNFYCPFCAYSNAISKYLEAKEKATLARKDLAAFIHKRPERSHPQNHGNFEQDREEDRLDKTHESGDLGERGFDHINNEEHACIVKGHHKKTRGDEQTEEPILSCKVNGHPEKTRGNKQTSNGLKHLRMILSSNKKEAGGIQKEVLQKQSSNLVEKPVCTGNIDGETSDDESGENMVSNYFIRSRRRRMGEKQYVYPLRFPQLRRKKIPWTAEEEEMLKEGVQKLSNPGDRTIPWTKILEYGSSVFLKERNATDLKDKWRNMCKGSPKYK